MIKKNHKENLKMEERIHLKNSAKVGREALEGGKRHKPCPPGNGGAVHGESRAEAKGRGAGWNSCTFPLDAQKGEMQQRYRGVVSRRKKKGHPEECKEGEETQLL